MDIVLSFTFASQQHLNGVIDAESYWLRLQELLEEAGSYENSDELMLNLAKFFVKP